MWHCFFFGDILGKSGEQRVNSCCPSHQNFWLLWGFQLDFVTFLYINEQSMLEKKEKEEDEEEEKEEVL